MGFLNWEIQEGSLKLIKKMEVQPPSEFVLDIPIVRHYKYLGVVFDDSL